MTRASTTSVPLAIALCASVLTTCGESVSKLPPELEGGPMCETEELAPLIEGASHVESCQPVTFKTSPPASGTHYPSWPVFRAYDTPVPWGFLVHGLEHGVVVIAYNCPDGCADDVAAAKALMAAVPARGCGRPPVILTPDPTLTTRFAAAAWGQILRAPCFTRSRFWQFIDAHMNRAPEISDRDCGVLDLESTAWCPL